MLASRDVGHQGRRQWVRDSMSVASPAGHGAAGATGSARRGRHHADARHNGTATPALQAVAAMGGTEKCGDRDAVANEANSRKVRRRGDEVVQKVLLVHGKAATVGRRWR